MCGNLNLNTDTCLFPETYAANQDNLSQASNNIDRHPTPQETARDLPDDRIHGKGRVALFLEKRQDLLFGDADGLIGNLVQ
jgi:hypothetical protein